MYIRVGALKAVDKSLYKDVFEAECRQGSSEWAEEEFVKNCESISVKLVHAILELLVSFCRCVACDALYADPDKELL